MYTGARSCKVPEREESAGLGPLFGAWHRWRALHLDQPASTDFCCCDWTDTTRRATAVCDVMLRGETCFRDLLNSMDFRTVLVVNEMRLMDAMPKIS